jgi:Mrp family chromosome partitioning ATPase
VNQLWVQKKPLPQEIAERRRGGESRSVARFRPNLATAHHPSFVQLYYALEARRTSSTSPMTVQFVSPSPGAGVSTVASGYACVAAMGRPTPVLFVDASCRKGKQAAATADIPPLIDAFERGVNLGEATVPARNGENLLWARLCDHPDALLEIGGDRLQDLFSLLGSMHQLVILDSASIERPESAVLSRYCDGSLLVLEAGVTSQAQIDLACRRLKQFGGVAVGIVLNRERRSLAGKRIQLS